MDTNLHPAQIHILRELLFRPSARFSQLNVTGLTTDHFTFHLNRLLELDLVVKNGHDYTLTPQGKEYANRLDTDSLKLERQAKTSTLIVCTRQQGIHRQYLISQRLKQPYYGFYGWIGGKKKWGESILESAARELQEETGTTATLRLVGIKHKRDYLNNNVQEDKFFFVIHATNLQGQVISDYPGGRSLWLTRPEILALPNLFDDLERSMDMIDSTNLQFVEVNSLISKY
jgi:8-oxo-dGTP pyrophosphatase MutT (NUDIX family)